MGYKFVDDLTSDVMFEAEGEDLAELLNQASLALFEIVCQREKIEPREFVEIEARGDNPKDLLHEWLSALLTESDSREMFFSKFEIEVRKDKNGFIATGRAWGEPYSPDKSETVVKGITYYKFGVEKTKEGWKARVVCDI